MTLIAVFVVLMLAYALVSARLERTVITGPIVFTAAGALALLALPGLHDVAADTDMLLHLAEVGLVLLLFTDACRTDLDLLAHIRSLPARLLSTGMLLTLGLGMAAAKLVFPELTWPEAGILSAILAPTDAGLGQIIVNSPQVPLKIRQALNVEAGLNDGLSVPFLLFFMALAGGAAAVSGADALSGAAALSGVAAVSGPAAGERVSLTRFIIEQLGYGVFVGAAIGLLGGWLMSAAHRRGWMTPAWRQLGLVALPLLCLLVSEAVGASMFIAAFVAGLAVQTRCRDTARHSGEFTEDWGQLINLSVFFLFGLFVARGWTQFVWRHALYAALSLTVVRMLPVAVALKGTRLSRASVLFMGWFGPRGLASIVLGMVFIEHDLALAGLDSIRLAVMLTVLCSIVAHGLSALPGMQLYARAVARLPPDAPELEGESAEAVPRPVDLPAV